MDFIEKMKATNHIKSFQTSSSSSTLNDAANSFLNINKRRNSKFKKKFKKIYINLVLVKKHV